MTTKAAFTEDEWRELQWAVADTVTYVSMADPGFWDTLKESKGAAKFMAGVKTTGDDELVRDLAANFKVGRDKTATSNPAEIASAVCDRIGSAAQIVAQKAPDDLPAFKEFILGVAQATAEAAKGVAPAETDALEKIRAALG